MPNIHTVVTVFLQVFDLRHCYEEMQRQAREACAAVAAQTAAVRGRCENANTVMHIVVVVILITINIFIRRYHPTIQQV